MTDNAEFGLESQISVSLARSFSGTVSMFRAPSLLAAVNDRIKGH